MKLLYIVTDWIHRVKNRHRAEPLIDLEWACRCGMEVEDRVIHGGDRPYVETPTYRNF